MEFDYAPSLSSTLIANLEEAARGIGLPLREIELLGQDPYLAQAFVDSVRAGDHDVFLSGIDWDDLHGRLMDRTIAAPEPSFPQPSDPAQA